MQQGSVHTHISVGRLVISVGSAITAAILVPSCTSSIDDPAATTSGGPSPQAIDVTQLDVGDYPTRPRAPLGVAGSPAAGAIIEGQRMADYVIGPWEVDASLIDDGHYPSFNGYSSSARISPEIPLVTNERSMAIAERHPLIVGLHTVRGVSKSQKRLITDVLRLVDQSDAAAAAADIGEAIQTGNGVYVPVTAVTIPGHPDAVAATHRYDEPGDFRRYTAVQSAVAHGPYVLVQEARSPEGLDAALAMAAKTIDLQGPLIDEFQATDPAELADVQIDPTGLLARTLPVAPQDYSVDHAALAVFEPRGALHFQHEPVRRSAAMTDAGVDLVANGKDIVYQARDDAAAARLVEAFAAEVATEAKPAAPVNALPGSRCFLLGQRGSMSYCVPAAVMRVCSRTGTRFKHAARQCFYRRTPTST